ncbi:Competence protein CoiA-like family, contains a predicted nuclease domain [Alteribacillus persepolensis]|uniref:Competence protein CoiA-like family, contains a predicted nuclease domain n=1 Tax=Alteribacillus persepolensis TaxID=568899 RepID=A0A1G8EPP3_9BACI|nr:competence protein CoiA family protein [Alteribacillus persepolensis]SDH71835.1 Competence protein CoiA-like family, contains a predicted nuclease domain [Alteribacillus persepolensis]
MFTARTRDGRIISLFPSKNEEIPSHYPPYFCPACSKEVILKQGKQVKAHFAHRKKQACSYQAEPETNEHLSGKALLYEWLLMHHVKARMEVYLSAIQRVADVLFTWRNKTYALEFQCSSISPSALLSRSYDYLSIGIFPIWIFSFSRLRPRAGGSFSVHALEWEGMRNRKSDARYVLTYFDAEKASFYYLFPTAYVSPQHTYADLYQAPLSRSHVSQLVNIPSTYDSKKRLRTAWLSHKRTWRFSKNQWRQNPDKTYMRQVFASKRSDLPFFPIEAGWPSYGMEVFYSPAYIWQSWFLLCFLENISLYQRFSNAALEQESALFAERRVLGTRTFPLITQPFERALWNYLEWLERLGVVKWTNWGWQKRKDIHLPVSLEQADAMDKKWGKHIL